jgi:hypothetical protein
MRSVDHVLTEFQSPKVGETIGYGKNEMRIERCEPERSIAWRSRDGNWVWTFRSRAREANAAAQPQALSPAYAGGSRRHGFRWSRPRW